MSVAHPRPSDVLDAWSQAMPLERPEAWIDPRSAVIAGLAARFRSASEAALAHRLDRWHRKPGGPAALVLLLDLFPRFLWQGMRHGLSGDLHAQSLALQALAKQRPHDLPLEQRALLLFPLMHAEDVDMQARAVEGFSRIVREHGEVCRPLLEHALARQEVIVRFGRFPHRNEILERVDSRAEAFWLATDAPSWAVPWAASDPGPKAQ